MIDGSHALPVAGKSRELGISRGSVYYLPRPVPAADLALMRRIDNLHLEHPFAGSSKAARLRTIMMPTATTMRHTRTMTRAKGAAVVAHA